MSKTIFEKIWDAHIVREVPEEMTILYIDRHLTHESTSPQAFAGLRMRSLGVRRRDATIAVVDHNIPTMIGRRMVDVVDQQSALCITTMERNAHEFNIPLFSMNDPYQGIVHVTGPELGLAQPGMTLVCGDSHTSTQGALGVFAIGIGTSEVEQVLATQCLLLKKPKTMNIRIHGTLSPGVTAKDVALAFIGKLGTRVGTHHVIEFSGSIVSQLSIEGRMTLCNMAIEAGARAGIVAPDEKTFDYLEGCPFAPQGQYFKQAVTYWQQFISDPTACFDAVHELAQDLLEPQVTWGTNPSQVTAITGCVPNPTDVSD